MGQGSPLEGRGLAPASLLSCFSACSRAPCRAHPAPHPAPAQLCARPRRPEDLGSLPEQLNSARSTEERLK